MQTLTSLQSIVAETNSRSVSELFDKCEYEHWQYITQFPNYYDLCRTAIELFVKKKLDEQRVNLWKYACKYAQKQKPDFAQFDEFQKIFMYQGVDPANFAQSLRIILEKKESKINALRIIGMPNTCKTLISNCIVDPFICCRMNNHGSENEFFMSNMLNKSIIQCEELYITIATAEDFKSVLGGQLIDVAKKFNEKQTLMRTPVIITSNYDRFGRGHVPPLDEGALASRCLTYRFNSMYKPSIMLCWQQFYLYMLSFFQ